MRSYIQLRVEAYIINHTNWQSFNSTAQFHPDTGQLLYTAGPRNRDGFGALTTVRGLGALGGPRIIQLAAKVYF